MSLFEKIKNKRYDLQEAIDEKGNITPEPGDKAIEKSILRNIKKKQNRTISQNKAAGDKLLKDINKRLSASTTRGDQARSQYSMGDGSTIGTPEGSTATKTKTVKQSEVSKKAKEFTKKINKKRTGSFDDVTGEGQVKYPKNRKDLIAKRKEYGIDSKGNISDAGVKRYAQKTKQLSSGSNLPVTPTQKELDIAKKRAVGGTPIKNKAGKVIGTTTGKYGGKLSRKRPSNAPSLAQIKAKIDAKNQTYTSPYTGGKLPVKQVKDPDLARMSSADRLKYKEIVKKYKTPKTVLKVTEPGSKFKKSKFKGFDEVPTSDPVGKEILKKMDRTVNVPPKPSLKKPNVFQKLSKKLFDPEGWKIPKKDYDLKPLRVDKATGFPLAQTRRSFKRVLKIPGTGALRKGFAMLPNRYKVLGGLALTTYALTRPKDTADAKPGKITYKKVEKPLGFDTGRKINQDRISYNQFLKKNNMTDPQQKTLLAKQKERSDNAAARARRNSAKPAQYGSTFTYKDKDTGKMATGSKLTTKKPKNINKNLP